MCSFKSIYFVIFILNLYGAYSEISDKRLCVDPQCNEPVSLARTLLRYSSPDSMILSFAPNTEVTIYSKEAGSETSLWGAVIKGKRGYIPKHLVREHKVFKKPTLLVDTELKQKSQVPKEGEKSAIDPDNVKKSYEVVDGTTIYLNPQDKIEPSTTESPVLATSLPPDTNGDKQATPVNSPKEKEVPVTENAQESVVENVFSSLSNWMNDEDSEEQEVEDEEEDDDEDDEEDEEDSLEQNPENSSNKLEEKTAQDINLLHNLSKGVKITPYNFEVSQETSKEKELAVKESPPELKDSKSTVDSKAAEDTQKETVPLTNDVKDPPPLQEAVVHPKPEETVTDSSLNVNEIAPSPEKKEPELANVTSDNESVGKPEQTESEKVTNGEGNLDTVTESSMDIEVAIPILDDVTTPSSLDLKGQEDLQSDPTSQTAEENKIETDPPTNVEKAPDLQHVSDSIVQISTTDKPVLSESSVVDGTSDVHQKESSEAVTENGSKLTDNNIFNGNSTDTVPDNGISKGPDDSEVEIPKSTDQIVEVATSEASVETDNIKSEQTIINEEPTDENLTNISQAQTHIQGLESSSEVPSDEVAEAPPQEATEVSPQVVTEAPPQEVTEAYLREATEASPQEVTEAMPQEVNEAPPEDVTEVSSEKSNAVFSEEATEIQEGAPESAGIWSGLFSFFGSSSDDSTSSVPSEEDPVIENKADEHMWVPEHLETAQSAEGYCDAALESCNTSQQEADTNKYGVFENINLKFNSDFFVLLITTAGSVIVFLIIYMALDRSKREAPLVARINKLEKELLVTLKENELLQENGPSTVQEVRNVPDEVVEQLTQRLAEAHQTQRVLKERLKELENQLEAKAGLEEQIESLEKELETSTEVGMELNRIISEMLDPTNGSDRLKENVEQLQRQLLEQKDTINSISETLREKKDENHTLRGDLEKSKKVVTDLQNKLDEMVERILKIERERDQQQNTLQNEITVYQQKYKEAVGKEEILNNEIQTIRLQLSEAQRTAEIKTKEYQTLRESLDKIKSLKNDSEALKSLLDATSIKAEIQQLKAENVSYTAQLQQEQAVKVSFEKKYQALTEEMGLFKQKYEQADKEKVEVNAKLDVLNNYFKKRESELQEEIIRYKSIWDTKEGEATSTTERIKYMQEEIENYKAQNETLKQEIISQEIELKSQISVLEKKVHENWVVSRQTERKLEDARQEAAQLRNRLTLRERAINEERVQNRLQSPVDQNGELPLSPHPMESPASPPLLYGGRDHITKSPPIPGMPPFLPPPPGAPFMPPPLHGMPPFMPPLPSMFPGDHRPPPLGRMSSPPLNSRYSPNSSAFSPYDRRSPSPPYDSEYGASPPPMRGYSPYNGRDDRRDYKRQPHGRTNGRNAKGPVMSSGSDHSNDSLDKINRKQSKMV